MKDDFQAIKDLVDIQKEIERRTGQTLKKQGSGYDYPGGCPNCGGHDCVKITPGKGTWNCFQCEAGGSVIDFVMEYEKCTNHEALTDLAEVYNHSIDTPKRSNTPPPPMTPKASIFDAVAKHCAQVLHNTHKALQYQQNDRGHSPETLKAMGVGFTDGNCLRMLQQQKYPMEEITRSGVVKEDGKGGYRDFFPPGLFIYPHLDEHGQIYDFTTKDSRKKFNIRLKKEFRGNGGHFLNMPALKKREVILVEGENDLLTLLDAGYTNVIATTGQLTEVHLKYLEKKVESGEITRITTCFDNDKAGIAYRERIEKKLSKYCYSDRQVAICERLRKSNLKKQKEAQDDEPVANEIPKLTQLILDSIVFDRNANDIDDYLRSVPNPAIEFKRLYGNTKRYLKPLTQIIPAVRAWFKLCDIKHYVNDIGEVVFEYFKALGGFFVHGEDCRLFYQGKIYDIGSGAAFKALLYDVAGLNYAENNTKVILEVLKARAYLNGKHTEVMGWTHTDLQNNAHFIDLNCADNIILKLQAGRIELIQNGANDDQVLLQATPRILPVNFRSDADVQAGMDKLYELILDNLACSASNKYYIAARIFSMILIEVVNARGITKFSGDAGVAKSCAARLISYLVFGRDGLTQGSVASYRSEAIKSMALFMDNLEQADINKEMLAFLTVAATGIGNQKRDGNTKSDNIYEDNKTHVFITSIEPFVKSELITRVVDIFFKKEFQSGNFPGETVLKAQIEKHRDLILSAILKIVAHDILPDFEQHRAEIYRFLQKERAGHAKERLDDMLACLYLYCNQIVKYIPHPEHTGEKAALAILDDWISEQNEIADSMQKGTNDILYRLDVLAAECERFVEQKYFIDEYGIKRTTILKKPEGELVEVKFLASTSELCTAFNMLAKTKGITNPFGNKSKVLASRLSDSESILKTAGWEVERCHKAIRGTNYHLLSKSFTDDEV